MGDDYFKTNDPEFESCQKYDVILSNGPFSVHQLKPWRFSNVFNALKPSGKIVFSSCALLKPLEKGIKYPPGMEKLMLLDDIRPLLEQIGFLNVGVDMSNRKVSFDVEIKNPKDKSVEGKRVFVGPESFSDPKYGFADNINEYVARVTVTASRPSNAENIYSVDET